MKLLKARGYTFDTGPLFLYFGENVRAKALIDDVRAGRSAGSTCETNLAELYYKTCERSMNERLTFIEDLVEEVIVRQLPRAKITRRELAEIKKSIAEMRGGDRATLEELTSA